MTEYVMLQRRRLPGVYVVPSAGSPLKWFGVLFIWQGHYQGGVFRFTLYMPHNYPDGDCPVILQGSEKMVIRWSKIWQIGWMRHNFPFQGLKFFFIIFFSV
ncbi:AKT-interacting protein-like isoform X1 [Tachypleus tridentatus]|uniref:AKT-interacting protein-like isoform X1 n=2 Tax=Tachypleus tridentatus TaxID=6853 RepID=UPI003FD2BD3D